MNNSFHLALRSVVKSFGATRAVAGASIDVSAGEVVALLGENGAGKSTLMHIASGALRPDSGSIEIDGVPAGFRSTADAARAGIAMVHQHFTLVDEFTIAENLALASETLPVYCPASAVHRVAATAVDRSGIALGDLSRTVRDLSVGEKAKIELVKALAVRPRILILDEPTSVLTPVEVAELARSVRAFAAGGIAVVFITHKLAEVFDVADRFVVMRRGEVVHHGRVDGTSREELARAMVPREFEPVSARAGSAGTPVLTLSRVSTRGGEQTRGLTRVDLEVRSGEIVAIAGVAGNGQVELARLLRGLADREQGIIEFDGHAVSALDLFAERQIAHIPEDRTADGFVGPLSIAENLALGSKTWHRRDAEAAATRAIAEYGIVASGPGQAAQTLSGGNQQKMVVARELARRPKLIVACEPTRGLDVAASADVRRRLAAAASSGAAVLLITSDLDEAFELASSISVMYRGTLSERVPTEDAHERVALMMAGLE